MFTCYIDLKTLGKVLKSVEKEQNVLKENRNFGCQNCGISLLIAAAC